jgi:predicted CxxxxCH...CXXCH cytochrome family protein
MTSLKASVSKCDAPTRSTLISFILAISSRGTLSKRAPEPRLARVAIRRQPATRATCSAALARMASEPPIPTHSTGWARTQRRQVSTVARHAATYFPALPATTRDKPRIASSATRLVAPAAILIRGAGRRRVNAREQCVGIAMADSSTRQTRNYRQLAFIFGVATCSGCLEHRGLPEHQASDCSGCHGDPTRATKGSDNAANVLLRAAPPFDVQGHSSSDHRGVGAHSAHINDSATHASIACATCHLGAEPSVANDSTSVYYYARNHIDGKTTLEFAQMATANGATPSFDVAALTCAGSWCHGPSAPSSSVSPAWTLASGPLGCTGCHGTPPPAPHPQVSNCASCHGEVAGGKDGRTIINPSLHVNGQVNVQLTTNCNGGCHGTASSPAPPLDVSGASDSSAPGVGAHQKHLNTTTARQVQCNDCHVVPTSVDSPGHLNPAPGSLVVFSALASSGSVNPVWSGMSCTNVYCHNPATASQPTTGGSVSEPQWTSTGQVVCGSCHGLPPPSPHPSVTGSCNGCHTNLTSSMGFIDVSKHINGTVDF